MTARSDRAGPRSSDLRPRLAATEVTNAGRHRQRAVFLAGLVGRRTGVPFDPRALERAALGRMSRKAAAYVAGGAGIEGTMEANAGAFARHRIVQRMLRDVSHRDLSVELFGRRLPLPILLAPIGVIDLAHHEGDLAAARAAATIGVPFVISSQSCVPMESIAQAMGDAPKWFQLYWSSEDAVAESFVRRAEVAGCEAIVVTLDTTELGWRPRDLGLGYLPFLRGRGIANYLSDPAFRALAGDAYGANILRLRLGALRSAVEFLRHRPRGPEGVRSIGQTRESIGRFIATYSRPDLCWGDLPRIRSWTRLPVVLKGIVHPDDARQAVEAGADGIVVSNHGGRQVDGAIGALDALPGVVEAVDGRVPVLFDSGVRTGADVLKALALGARAVLVGRPYVWGLALRGEAGAREVIENLAAELDLTLGLSGHRSLAELDPSVLAHA